MALDLAQTAIGALNEGQHSLTTAEVSGQPVLLGASRDRIVLLDEDCSLLKSLPFELAFPLHSALTTTIQAVAFDSSSGRIAAASEGRIGVWESTGSSWRIHSSFKASHGVTALDFARDQIVVGGDSLSLWSLDQTHALPSWSCGCLESASSPVLTARLSPSAQVLASVKTGSSLVRLSSVGSRSSAVGPGLRFRCHAAHSLRIREISWRPTDDPADSGPILFTTTCDGVYRIWGCMIDEPDFFSLWATLDVHGDLPKHLPLATCFRATKNMPGGAQRRGTDDEFLTVFSDGSVHLTTVSGFDCRPPTCLIQSTTILKRQVFDRDHLASLRYPSLLVTSLATATLVGRCSRGTLVRLTLRASESSKALWTIRSPAFVPVNITGRIRHLVPSFDGQAMLALGDNGRIQSWEVGEGEVVTESFVSDPRIKSSSRIATWHNGRMVATATPEGLKVFEFRQSGQLRLVHHLEDVLPPLETMFVARSEQDSLSTTIVAITTDFFVLTWTFSSALRQIEEGASQSLNEARSPANPLVVAAGVPPRSAQGPLEHVEMFTVDYEGTICFWRASIPDSTYSWTVGAEIKTERSGVALAACNAERKSALVTLTEDAYELSIWDSKSSEFSSGLQHSEVLTDEVIDLDWSPNGDILAVSTPARVQLFCAQRLDDLSGSPSWIGFASVEVSQFTSAPISAACWLAKGLAVASSNNLAFYSSVLKPSGEDCHDHAASRLDPLPYHHPQLLFQALLHGYAHVVLQILEGLAAQLTADGDLTPLRNSRANEKITVEDFMEAQRRNAQTGDGSNDIFSALTNGGRTSPPRRVSLTEDGANKLLAALRKCPLRELSKLEHAHLAVVVQTAYEVQRLQGSLDSNGLRYLVSMRSFFIYNHSALPSPPTSAQRLKFRDVVWAFHSESQDILLEESVKACSGGKLTWVNAKALGVFLWLKSPEVLSRQLELVGRTEYIQPDRDDKDPITATLFYLALRKKHIVVTFWKQAGGHADQRSMLKFLANDFELPRWRSAALKNAFALMSKQRFLFAAAFFLLGDSLKDAVNVCLRQLDDFQLAIAITRVHEGDDGPVLRMILEDTVLPLAFKNGFRWLASWSFWMLNRRDLAVQTIVTPLAELASRLPYRLASIGSLMHEDPCLVLLFEQLRSRSLQTVKGAVAVSGRTEFNFVLHMSRVLCRMGCHPLALSLLRNYEFIRPEPATPSAPRLLSPRGRMGLRRASTIRDLEVDSNMPSRAPSPVRDLPGGQEFHKVLKRVKVEKIAEFDMGAFGF